MTRPQAQPDGGGVKAGVDHHNWPAAPARIPEVGDERPRVASDDDVELGWVWTTLVLRWRLLLAAIVVGTGITAALVLMSPPPYEAAATLVVPGAAASPSSNANAVRSVLTSSAVLSNVNAALESEQFRASLDTGSIQVDPVGGTTLVRLRVRGTDAAATSRAAALLAERGAAAAREMREKALRTAKPAVDTDVEEAAKRLEGSEQRLLEFRRQARIELLQSQIEQQLEARRASATIDRDLQRERARLQAATAEMEQLQRRPDPSRPDQHAALLTSLAGLAAESRAVISALESARKQAGADAGSGEMKSLDELYQRQLELKRLERQVTIAEQLYTAQLVRSRQSDPVQAVPLVELADATIGPAAPVGRDVPRKVALGFVLSLLLGSGLVVFLEAARS